MAESGGWGDCTLPPTRGWPGSMEASKVVPACHDILVFGLCPDVARPMAAARSGSVQHSRSTKGLWGSEN